MDLSTICIWCWLIPLLVGLLCGYFGYLIGKGKSTGTIDSGQLQHLEEQNAKLKADLAACREQTGVSLEPSSVRTTEVSSPDTSGDLSGIAAGNALQAEATETFDAAAAKAILGKTVKLNDLKVIEGIGPKIENLFQNEGITTWLQLADANVARCREVLSTGGDRYRLHDPASWPMQARMCAEGKWKDLARWQDDHKRGKL